MESVAFDRTQEQELDVDVAIVGYGPVGQALAALLGRAGHRVAVFERFKDIYRLPRAIHLDHEIMRLLQSLGLAEAVVGEMVPLSDYHWFGADGDLLLRFDGAAPARSGWDPDYMFFQPELEAALDALGCAQPGVTVERGWAAVELVDSGAGARLTVRSVVEEEPGRLALTGEVRTVRAAWVVGADGANSFVREASGITRRDLGFQERWLVIDAEPRDMEALAHLPTACQWCDPNRPTTHAQSGPRHRRWEFMLLPDEHPADFEHPDRVWSLLEPWYRPDDGPLTRSAVYEFRSMVADQMRSGHVLLVGDAAHLTPPFLGQGLCSGLRDAANVAWKLDLVLRGLAPERLLDTVDTERQPQNEAVIRLAIELGKVLCQLDPQVAAERDAMLRQAGPPPPLELAPLNEGVLHQPTSGRSEPLAGTLSVQGLVAPSRQARTFRYGGRLARPRRAPRRARRGWPPHGMAGRAGRPRGARAPGLLRLRQRVLSIGAARAARGPSSPTSDDADTRTFRSPVMTYPVHTLNAKLRRFVDANTVGVLATPSLDGRPRQSLVYFTRVDDRLLISTLSDRLKTQDVRRSGWASLCVMGHEPPYPSATFAGPAEILTEDIGAPTATIMQRITRAAEPPEPMSDEALAEVGRVILAITVERVTAANYIDAAANAGAQSR